MQILKYQKIYKQIEGTVRYYVLNKMHVLSALLLLALCPISRYIDRQ